MPLVFDVDDVEPGADAMDLLQKLKEANEEFRCTLFGIPGKGDDSYWNGFPNWVELAMHGYLHPDPYECAQWDYERTLEAIERKPAAFVNGWRSPGWQSSDALFKAMHDSDWWVADHPENDDRRPAGLLTHVLDEGDHLHTHVAWNGSGNAIPDNFDKIRRRVEKAKSFAFVSEVVKPWQPR